MDYQKIYRVLKSLGITVLLLLWAKPALADGGVSPGMEFYASSGETVPIYRYPDLPAAISFPIVDHSSWASNVERQEALKSSVQSRVNTIMTAVNQPMTWSLDRLEDVHEVIYTAKTIVGDPHTVSARDSYNQTFTLSAAASQMSSSVRVATSYLRAVSRIGPVGLNLTFLFVGLIWIIFVNLLDFLFSITAILLRIIMKIVEFVVRFIMLIIAIVDFLIAVVDLVLPF